MLALLKAELEYHKISILFFGLLYFGLSLFISLSAWNSAEEDGIGLMRLALTAAFIIWLFRFTRLLAEKSDRFLRLIPLAGSKIGLARVLFGIAVWFGFLTIFICWLLLFRSSEANGWLFGQMAYLSGIWLIFNAFPFIHRDVSFIFSNLAARVLLTLFYVILYTTVILIVSASAINRYVPALPDNFINYFYSLFFMNTITFSGAFIFFLVSLLISLFSVFIYSRRSSYLS